jgi:hypothetical protein
MNEIVRKFFGEYLVGLFDHFTEEVEGSREHKKLVVLFVVEFRLAVFLLVVVVFPQDQFLLLLELYVSDAYHMYECTFVVHVETHAVVVPVVFAVNE